MFKKTNALLLLQILLSILFFIYVLFRAIRLDITYDEAWTLKDFVPLSFMHILNYTPCDANNHILNTLLIKFFYLFGSESVFMARLPNVLAFVLYLIYSFKISKFLPPFSAITVFILLVLNPFLIDFFSLARGYGLGLSFQMASVYFLLSFVRFKHLKYSVYTLLFASLAVLSNFSQLNYWVTVLLILSLFGYISSDINKRKFAFYIFLNVTSFVLIIFEPIRKLISGGKLYYGGDNNFYSDTLVSLTKYTEYSPQVNNLTLAALNVFLLITTLGVVFLLLNNIKSRIKRCSMENVLFLLLFFSILSSLAQHYLLGTLFLIDRTALFYYPLFVLMICFSFSGSTGIMRKIVFPIMLFFFSLNFFSNINTYKTALWFFDSHTPEILNVLNKSGAKENKKIKIDFSWPFQSAVYYYCENKKLYPFIDIVKDKADREKVALNADYYFYLDKSLEKVGYEAPNQKILPFKKDTVLFYSREGVYVFTNIAYK